MPPDPLRYFRVEARELVDALSRGAVKLEHGDDPDLVRQLLRHAHTLKGAARVVRQPAVATHAHALEDLLGALATPPAREQIDRFLALVEEIERALAGLDAPAPTPAPTPALAPPAPVRAEAPRGERRDGSEGWSALDADELERVRSGVDEIGDGLRELGRRREAMVRAGGLADLLVRQLATAPGATRAVAAELQDLIAAVGRETEDAIARADRELADVRASVARLALVPVGSLFAVAERTAREVARMLGREVRLVATGGGLRLEAMVVAQLHRAIVQLVRNAVAHGIEPRSTRLAIGKDGVGTLRLDAALAHGRVRVTLSDDGGGIDLDAVRRAARSRGVAVDGLDDARVAGLLLAQPISTASEVTEAAGRGVGIDVVREAADALGGTVSVETGRGRGTTFALSFPVTRAALEVMGVGAGDDEVVVPLSAVRGALREGPELREVPRVALAGLLGVAGPSDRTHVLVEHGGQRVALGVERAGNVETVQVQPLPPGVRGDPVVAGAAVDASGRVRMVLEPRELVSRPGRADAVVSPLRARLPVLVVDDSLTTRMLEKNILEAAGFEVDVAASGEEGLEKARARRYGVLLVDIEMPGMSGFDVVAALRADPALRHLPVLIVSSRESAEDFARGEALGVRDWVVKSRFDQGRLLRTLREVLG